MQDNNRQHQFALPSASTMEPERCSHLRCESDHESPWSQFIAETEGRFSPMQLFLPRNFSPLTPVDIAENSFCSSKFSPTSCFPPPAKKRAVRCVYHPKECSDENHHLAIDVDPIGIDASRVSSESGGTSYSSPVDHVWGYNFSPYNDHAAFDEDQNVVPHDVSPLYSRQMAPLVVPYIDIKRNSDVESRSSNSSLSASLDGESEGTDDIKTSKKQFEDSVTSLLTTWILNNQMDPYPTQSEKERLAGLSGLSLQQVTDWLTNTRKRHLFPVISGRKVAKSALEKMFLHQAILVAKTQ